MHSLTYLAFCLEVERFGQLQSPGSSEPGREYLPSGQTVEALTAPPGQKWFSLQNCGKNKHESVCRPWDSNPRVQREPVIFF
jgi:hypothetical protein